MFRRTSPVDCMCEYLRCEDSRWNFQIRKCGYCEKWRQEEEYNNVTEIPDTEISETPRRLSFVSFREAMAEQERIDVDEEHERAELGSVLNPIIIED